jgi:hypothetical protein
MEVRAWSNGSGTFSVSVGSPNRKRFFDKRWTGIVVEIDGEDHPFALTGGFWRNCPEFRDRGTPVIKQWLRKYRSTEWTRGKPPAMELVPLEGNRFRLVP